LIDEQPAKHKYSHGGCTMKPNKLRVLWHDWNDGYYGYTIIAAHFHDEQTDIPDGWERATRFQYVGADIVYIKTFPYGTTVLNGRIIV